MGYMKLILSKDQVYEIVSANKYPVSDAGKCISRCSEGQYADSHNLPFLAIPGADLGDLALLRAAGNTYGFDVDLKKVYEVIAELAGGRNNFQVHVECGHMKQVILDPGAYHLTQNDVTNLEEIAEEAKKNGATEVKLEGDHLEGAIVQIQGPYSLKTRYFLKTDVGTHEVEIFVFHETLVNERHRALAKKLVAEKAVTLFNGLDEEYLYEVLSDTTEDHLMETARRLAKGLPLYLAVFDADGTFELTEMGKV